MFGGMAKAVPLFFAIEYVISYKFYIPLILFYVKISYAKFGVVVL